MCNPWRQRHFGDVKKTGGKKYTQRGNQLVKQELVMVSKKTKKQKIQQQKQQAPYKIDRKSTARLIIKCLTFF